MWLYNDETCGTTPSFYIVIHCSMFEGPGIIYWFISPLPVELGGGGDFPAIVLFASSVPTAFSRHVFVCWLSNFLCSFTMMPFKWSLTFVALNEHLQVHVLTLFFKWDPDYDRVSAALMINQSSNKGRWAKIRGTWSCRSYCTSPSNTEIISHIT